MSEQQQPEKERRGTDWGCMALGCVAGGCVLGLGALVLLSLLILSEKIYLGDGWGLLALYGNLYMALILIALLIGSAALLLLRTILAKRRRG